MVKSSSYVLAKSFEGEPKMSDLKLVEEFLRPIKEGEYVAEALYISVDPYMRVYAIEIGSVMNGAQVARIIESKNTHFPKGSLVVGYFGWRNYTLVTKDFKSSIPPYILPDIGDLSPSLAVGMLGMPGHTSYISVEVLFKPKAGEVIYVSGAAGAVGSHVGQLAKIAGCKVIGSAGTDKKCQWLVNELGFDHAFNYNTTTLDSVLKEHVPEGLDMFLDNVGDETINTVIQHMNPDGRIVLCGAISSYNSGFTSFPTVKIIQILSKPINICGIIIWRHADTWMDGFHYNLKYIQEGKLKYREHVTEGFDNILHAFRGMLRGENTGKAVVKV